MEKQQEPYFIQAARENGTTVKEYLNLSENYVIIQDGKVISWNGAPQKGAPCIYVGIEGAMEELKEWAGPIRNVSVIPEKEYIINTYGQEVWDFYNKPVEGTLWDAMDEDDWECHDTLQDLLKTYLPDSADIEKFERRFSELFGGMLDALENEFFE